MSRADEILYIGKEIIINCKKSEMVSYELGSTTVEMRVEKILPLFQNMLKSWDKECKKDKKKSNPIDEKKMDALDKWVQCEMRGYKVTERITLEDIRNIITNIMPSRSMGGIAVPYPIEVLEISINQGDRELRAGDMTLTALDMRNILSEVYTNIVNYVNEIMSEIDIELPSEGQFSPWMQYTHGPVEEQFAEPEAKDDSPVDEDAMKRYIMKNYGKRED